LHLLLLLIATVRGLWSVMLEWIEFECVQKESDCTPAVRRPKLAAETGLIVCQYDWLSQQQLSLLFIIRLRET